MLIVSCYKLILRTNLKQKLKHGTLQHEPYVESMETEEQ